VRPDRTIVRRIGGDPISFSRRWGSNSPHLTSLGRTSFLRSRCSQDRLLPHLVAITWVSHHGRGCGRSGTAGSARDPARQRRPRSTVDGRARGSLFYAGPWRGRQRLQSRRRSQPQFGQCLGGTGLGIDFAKSAGGSHRGVRARDAVELARSAKPITSPAASPSRTCGWGGSKRLSNGPTGHLTGNRVIRRCFASSLLPALSSAASTRPGTAFGRCSKFSRN
jgi:hypothetical protein